MKYIHRIIFYTILGTSIIWTLIVFNKNPIKLLYNFEVIETIKLTYLLGFTSMFWLSFYIEICDFIVSLQGKNGKLYFSYASSIKKDVVISFAASIILLGIYLSDSVPYSFSGIDLGFVGIPFMLMAIYAIFEILKLKVSGKPLRKAPILYMLFAIILFGFISISILTRNSSGEFEDYQSLWFQLTILFGSYAIYSSVSLQQYFLSKGKLELSNFKIYFFREVVKSKNKSYESMHSTVEHINKQNLKEKAKYSRSLRAKK